jgi:hypothetical protein
MTRKELCAVQEQRLFGTVGDFIPNCAIRGAAAEVAQLAVNYRGEELGALTSFHLDTMASLARMYSKDVGRWQGYRRLWRGSAAGSRVGR